MLRGYRGKFPKIGGLIAAALAILVSALLNSDFSSYDRALIDRAADASDNYREYTNERIRDACGTLSPVSKPDCIEEREKAAREYERGEMDVAAQLTMAWWTKIMGAAAVLGVALSAVGVYLIWETFRETRRAAINATKTYEAYVAVERPRLHIHLKNIWEDGDRIRCKVHAENYGRIDCIVYLFGSDWRDKTSDATDKGIVLAQQKNALIKPGAQAFLGVCESRSIKTEVLYVIVKYKSAFSSDHRAYAAFQIFDNRESGAPTANLIYREIKIKGMPDDT